jgi:hypothetical protein
MDTVVSLIPLVPLVPVILVSNGSLFPFVPLPVVQLF